MARGRPRKNPVTTSDDATNPMQEDKDTKTASVVMPTPLWEAVDEEARKNGLTLTSWIKQQVAPLVNFQGDIGELTRRYATEQERKDALKRANDEKNAIVKAAKAAMAAKDKAAGVQALLASLSITLTPEQLKALANE